MSDELGVKNLVFLNFIWTLVLALVGIFGFFKYHYNGHKELIIKSNHLAQQVEELKLRSLVAESSNMEFQQKVAQLLPALLKDSKWTDQFYAARNIASVVGIQRSDKKIIELFRLDYEKAKRDFREKNYGEAADGFRRLLREQPLGLNVVEANFLLAECLFQIRNYEDFTIVVNDMVELFPESELTGFILLRLGQIFEGQDRVEDAQEIYRVVFSTFDNQQLRAQAKSNLEAASL